MKTPAALIDAVASAGPTVMDELARLNKAIESNEHALLIAKRLAASGRPISDAELAQVRTAHKQAQDDFAALSSVIARPAAR